MSFLLVGMLSTNFVFANEHDKISAHNCAVHCENNNKDNACVKHCQGDSNFALHNCAEHCKQHTDSNAKMCVNHCEVERIPHQ